MNGFGSARIAAGLSQNDVAAKLGINRTTISKWESGQAKPRADLLLRIAKTYKCTLEEILDMKPEEGGTST